MTTAVSFNMGADIEKPGAAVAARARHRRSELPCTTDLTAALVAVVEQYLSGQEHAGQEDVMRDVRHRKAAAWPDLSDYLDDLQFQGYADRTLNGYERSIALLLRTNLDTPFAEFDKPALMRAITCTPERSRYITRSIYQGWFDWGIREDRLDRNAMDKVPKLSAGQKRPSSIFSAAEVAILEARPLPNGALWSLLFHTGLRREDACKLKRGHIDLDRMRLMVYKGKGQRGGKDAEIPFGDNLARVIADLDLFEALEADDHLWTREKHNRTRKYPISRTTFARWYEAELADAGIDYRNPHQTRHTYHWVLKHVRKLDLEARQLLMRHASPVTTIRQYPVVDVEDVAKLLQGGPR